MFGEMAQMLLDKGLDHEAQVLARYEAAGRTVHHVPGREPGETFEAWAARVSGALDGGHDVLYQMPLVHDGIRGVADFLERVTAEDGGVTYEPVDAKLARSAAKPGHVLQLCFYAEAIEAATGVLPERMRIELGSGTSETIRVADVLPYWRRLRGQLARLLTEDVAVATRPKPCDHCQFCEFELVCDAEWRAADSLVHVAGVRTPDRLRVEAQLQDVAGLGLPTGELGVDRLVRGRARLGVVDPSQEVGDAPDALVHERHLEHDVVTRREYAADAVDPLLERLAVHTLGHLEDRQTLGAVAVEHRPLVFETLVEQHLGHLAERAAFDRARAGLDLVAQREEVSAVEPRGDLRRSEEPVRHSPIMTGGCHNRAR
jgi:hypothetical protein